MNPIGERALWFALGLLVGWLSAWLLMRARRRSGVHAARSTPQPATPQPVPPPADARPDPAPTATHARHVDVSAARAAGFNMRHADDLAIIEGIGPKTVELLHANGIDRFVQVASLQVGDLLDILERGGPNFRLADPANWAQQARLASENRWADLKQLQREMLDGGAGSPPP